MSGVTTTVENLHISVSVGLACHNTGIWLCMTVGLLSGKNIPGFTAGLVYVFC